MKKRHLVLIALIAAMALAVGCTSSDIPAAPAVDNTALNVANANTGSIQALGGRVAALEGRATGEVTQEELDALAAQVTALSEQVAVLETTIAELDDTIGSDGTTSGNVLTETRWRLRPTFDILGDAIGATSPNDPDVDIYIRSVEPRTIKSADVYEISIEILNNEEHEVEYNDIMLSLLFEPNDNVIVSDDCDIYQVIGPYNIYWNTDIRTSTSTGNCRYIKAETDEFDATIKAGDTLRIDLEFELIYEGE